MTDGPADELPQGTPSRRALGAMESAVRRARESASGTPLPVPPDRERRPRPADPTPGPGRQPDRWLVTSVAVVAVLVVAGSIALAVSLASTRVAAPPSTTVARASTTIAGRPGGGAGRPPHPASTSTTRPAEATTTTTVPSTPGAAPVISSLTPSSGTVGQGIQVAGANFMSSNGQIVATFNGQVAPTSCPSQTTCSITVPPPAPGSQSAQVTITTASGTSNAVTFTYG